MCVCVCVCVCVHGCTRELGEIAHKRIHVIIMNVITGATRGQSQDAYQYCVHVSSPLHPA